MVDRLWERLDQAISSRESQLEAAIGKYDKMQKTYEHLNKDIKRLTSNLNTLKDQLGIVSASSVESNDHHPLVTHLLLSLSLSQCMSKYSTSFVSSKRRSASSSSASLPVLSSFNEINNELSKIKLNIHRNEKDIRQNLIDAHQLQDDNYPNCAVLIQG